MDEFQLVIFISLHMVLVSSIGLLPEIAKKQPVAFSNELLA